MWTSDRSQISVTYSDVNGAISAVNWNVIAGYIVTVTVHQLNPPKPDISVTKVGPSSRQPERPERLQPRPRECEAGLALAGGHDQLRGL
jgi:hypothetical protein